MRKIIFMAVAGYLWKKFKAQRAASPVADPAAISRNRPFDVVAGGKRASTR